MMPTSHPYKNFTPRSGVYWVKNTVNGRVWLGSNRHVIAILNRIRFQLELGSHPNRAMQADWREFGAAAFVFGVLDELDLSQSDPADSDRDLQVLLLLWRERLLAEKQVFYC
jgi:hypothetical protein